MCSDNALVPSKRLIHSIFLVMLTVVYGACTSAPAKPDPSGRTPKAMIPTAEKEKNRTAAGTDHAPAPPKQAAPQKKAKLSLFVMSKCPYAVEAELSLAKVFLELHDAVDFEINYIVNEQEGRFTSLHGESEVRGNILQLCARHHYSMKHTFAFILCQNKAMRTIPAGWEKCAQQVGLDPRKISSCADSPLGEKLLRASMKSSEEARAKGSPTIMINGSRVDGNRSKLTFMRSLCAEMTDDPPAPCLKIPAQQLVSLTILSDSRCRDCQTERLDTTLRARFFPNLKVHRVEFNSPEGKKLYKDVGERFLPLVLFQDDVKKAENYDKISRWLKPQGAYLTLRVPASFDPLAEICDNKKDDTGNKKIDCADPTCRAQLICRKEVKRRLDVFVMSQCPFAAQALLAAKEVLDNFKGKVKLRIHYVADQEKDGSFRSLHGQSEVDENIRQLCAKKYYSWNNRYLKYIWCRNKNYRSSDWKSCATGKIRANVLEKCANGKMGKRLLAQDIKLAQALNIKGSPSWLANNRFPFSGIAADTIKTELCRHNAGLKGCKNTLREKPIDPEIPSGSCGK